MLLLPPFQARQRRSFIGRVRNNNERHLHSGLLYSRLCARWRYSRGFPFHLAEVWRPGCVAETRCFVPFRELQQFLQRARGGLLCRVRIADFRKALWHREKREVGWVTVRDFIPMKRRRDTRVGKRAYRIRRAGGPILRILIVVEEHTMPLF